MQSFNIGDYKNAEPDFLAALKEDNNFIEAYFMLGYVDIAKDSSDDAIRLFKKTLSINPEFYPNIYFTLAKLDIGVGNYDEAMAYLQKFQGYNTQDPDMRVNTQLFMADCEFASEAIKHPVPFSPVNMGPAINSDLWEYFPAITVDQGFFIFTRRMPDEYLPEGFQEDLYESFKVNEEWTKAVSLSYLNTPHNNEGAPTLSADGNLLIYASEKPGGYGSVDLYYSIKYHNTWQPGKNLGSPVNTANWESQPCLSSDGRSLYFVRGNKHGEAKSLDIYLTQLSDTGTWSRPQRLSDTINTRVADSYPFIAADNQTLYFCSAGHPGFGGLDIFMSRRLPNGRWGIPKNLGYPINSSKDESSIMVNPNGQVAYFSSNRPGGYGGQDLYSFSLYDSIQSSPITYVKGKVYDAKTHDPLVGDFTLTDLSTSNVMVKSSSAPDDGTFLVTLPLNKNYALDVSRKGYLFFSENFSLQNVTASAAQPYTMDVPLQPIDTGAKIVLKNIFYETDKYNLKPESQIELNKLVNFLNANPTVKIELSGHTDNTGTVEHNIILSKNRAKSVYDYLISHSIPADRLTYKGYGQSQPIADNSTDAGRAKNRRTELKITGK